MRTPATLVRSGALALAVALALPSSGWASIGAGVGAVPLVPVGAVRLGEPTRVNDLYVVNTGTVRAAYRITVSRLRRDSRRVVPLAWVELRRTRLVLSPRGAAWVPVALRVPAGAPPGSYATNLIASTTAPGARGSARFGAAAAADLTFTIPGRSGSGLPLPPLLILGALALGAAATYGVSRSGVRLRVERANRGTPESPDGGGVALEHIAADVPQQHLHAKDT